MLSLPTTMPAEQQAAELEAHAEARARATAGKRKVQRANGAVKALTELLNAGPGGTKSGQLLVAADSNGDQLLADYRSEN